MRALKDEIRQLAAEGKMGNWNETVYRLRCEIAAENLREFLAETAPGNTHPRYQREKTYRSVLSGIRTAIKENWREAVNRRENRADPSLLLRIADQSPA